MKDAVTLLVEPRKLRRIHSVSLEVDRAPFPVWLFKSENQQLEVVGRKGWITDSRSFLLGLTVTSVSEAPRVESITPAEGVWQRAGRERVATT